MAEVLKAGEQAAEEAQQPKKLSKGQKKKFKEKLKRQAANKGTNATSSESSTLPAAAEEEGSNVDGKVSSALPTEAEKEGGKAEGKVSAASARKKKKKKARDTIEYADYVDERQLPAMMEMIDKDLSEPYSIFTYRFFLVNWPNLCICAYRRRPRGKRKGRAGAAAATAAAADDDGDEDNDDKDGDCAEDVDGDATKGTKASGIGEGDVDGSGDNTVDQYNNKSDSATVSVESKALGDSQGDASSGGDGSNNSKNCVSGSNVGSSGSGSDRWDEDPTYPHAGKDLVGVIICKAEDEADRHQQMAFRGYIAMLAVSKDHRKKGIGSTLVKIAVERMRLVGCEEVFLETEVTNVSSLSLYHRLGFCREERMKKYYLNGVDAFRLKFWFN